MTSHKNPWQKLDSKVVHKNPWYYVRQDKVITPAGKESTYDVVVSPPAVFIVALDKGENVHLVGQYRYTTDKYSIELPAGGTEGQDPLQAAKRELQEETGLTAAHWKELGSFYSANGLLSEISYVYLATGLTQTKENTQDEEGIDTVMKRSFKECMDMIKNGEITDGQTYASLLLAAAELDLLK